ncbi:Transmembrane and TPR repeat-containing protein CG4341 [Eumeta japonica]|uniref:Transmembrane and TPR repeat-containing protein CG4341 n=1 Tax=Eumeta variegata TaxID=151549 RepID=A0A4C1Z9K9_EUMVA|nr:Transmembrane and TPR repeat-containing protein CG4341 [Eumeta japonica]
MVKRLLIHTCPGKHAHALSASATLAALRARPAHSMSFLCFRGILLQNERRYEQAIKSFEKAIHFRPSMALAYVNLGASLVAAGRAAEAAGVLRAAARTTGDVRDRRQHDSARVSALVQLAALHSRRAHWHKALAAYREALDIMPETGPPLSGWTRHVQETSLTKFEDRDDDISINSMTDRVLAYGMLNGPFWFLLIG